MSEGLCPTCFPGVLPGDPMPTTGKKKTLEYVAARSLGLWVHNVDP